MSDTSIGYSSSQAGFVTQTQLEALAGYYKRIEVALEAASTLSRKADQLVDGAAQAVYQKFPYTVQMQGQQYASTSEGKAKCVRDISYYLRIIIYGLVAGNTAVIDESLLTGLDEINKALELSSDWYVEALKYIRSKHGLTGLAAEEANKYIDYVIQALS